MAQYTITGTFGTSFENSDTILLSVSSGSITPSTTTKGALAAGLNVEIDDGTTVTAVATSGACSNVIANDIAQDAGATPPVAEIPAAPGVSYNCSTRNWATVNWNSGTGAVTLTPSANTTIHSYEPTNVVANSGNIDVTYTFSNSEADWDNTDAQILCSDNLSINTGDTLPTFGCSNAGFSISDGIAGAAFGANATVTNGTLVAITDDNDNVVTTYAVGLNNYHAEITVPATGYTNSGQNITGCPAMAEGISTGLTGSFSGPVSSITPGVAGTGEFQVTSNTNWELGLRGPYATHFTLSKYAGGNGTTTIIVRYDGNPNFQGNVLISLRSASGTILADPNTIVYTA
jgi:hypothetical protein